MIASSSLSAPGRPHRGGGGIAILVALTLLVLGLALILAR